MKRALGAAVAVAACAHTPELALRPEPAPAGEEVASFAAHDGTQLWRHLAEVGLALRLFRDRELWPHAFAGAGPYLRGAILDAGGATALLVTVGIALYGAD